MTVEEKALIWARRQKGNVLNNRNVDCFIAGYNMAAGEFRERIANDRKEILKGLPDKLRKQLEDDEASFASGGYMYFYPERFARKKVAYTALCDALEKCEEFIDNIQPLLS